MDDDAALELWPVEGPDTLGKDGTCGVLTLGADGVRTCGTLGVLTCGTDGTRTPVSGTCTGTEALGVCGS